MACPLSIHPGANPFCKAHLGRRYDLGPESVEVVRRYEREWSCVVPGEAVPDHDGGDK